MERIGEDGGRREATPHEVAKLDQIMARYDEISHRLVVMYERIQEHARHGDTAQVAQETAHLRLLLYGYFPGVADTLEGRDSFDFTLYLIGLICSAKHAQSQQYETADALLHGVVSLLPPGHPVLDSPYLQREVVEDRLGDALRNYLPQDLLDKLYPELEEYTTGDGVLLEQVHPSDQCRGEFCVIHNPAPGPWDQWPTTWLESVRQMGRTCPHGMAHVCIEDLLIHPEGMNYVHDHSHFDCDCPCDLSRVEIIISDEGKLVGFRPMSK